MLITLMGLVGMFGPTPPPPSGSSGSPIIPIEEGGRYNKPKDTDKLMKENNEKIAIIVSSFLINNN